MLLPLAVPVSLLSQPTLTLRQVNKVEKSFQCLWVRCQLGDLQVKKLVSTRCLFLIRQTFIRSSFDATTPPDTTSSPWRTSHRRWILSSSVGQAKTLCPSCTSSSRGALKLGEFWSTVPPLRKSTFSSMATTSVSPHNFRKATIRATRWTCMFFGTDSPLTVSARSTVPSQ